MDFSKIPSISIRSARPLPERWIRGSPRTGSSGPRPTGEHSSGVNARLSPLAHAPLSFGPSLPQLESRSALAVPPGFGGLLRARGAGLLHPAADHGVRLVSGSPWPCALRIVRRMPDSSQKASAVSIPGDRQANHGRLSAVVNGRVRCTRASGRSPRPPEGARRCQGWSERSTARIGSLRTFSFESSLRRSHPRCLHRLAKSARCHQPSCLIACRAIPSGATPFEAFPSRTARSGSRVPVLLPPRRCVPWSRSSFSGLEVKKKSAAVRRPRGFRPCANPSRRAV